MTTVAGDAGDGREGAAAAEQPGAAVAAIAAVDAVAAVAEGRRPPVEVDVLDAMEQCGARPKEEDPTVTEDTQGSIEQGSAEDDVPEAEEIQPAIVKQERLDERELAENLSDYINLTNLLDSETILQVVGPKLLDHFSIWDLMLHKGRLTSDVGAMDTLLRDTGTVLSELRLLVESCLRPVKARKVEDEDGGKRRKRRRVEGAVEIDEGMAVALCVDPGLWKKRDVHDIDYYTPMLSMDNLFPEKRRDPLTTFRPPSKPRGNRKPKLKEEDAEGDIVEENGKEEKKDDGDPEDPDYEVPKRKRGRPKKAKMKEEDDELANMDIEERIKRERIKKEEEELFGETYLCLKCGQTLCKAYGKQHEAKCTGMYVRHPEYKKINDEYICTVDGCEIDYAFTSIYGLRQHFHSTHIREEEKYFACDYCDEKFSFKTSRNKHVKAKHLKSYVCDICGKGFGGKDKLTSHRYTHTGEKPYACHKCEYRAAKKYNLEMHLQSKHNDFGQKNFLCSICNKQFVTMGRVRRHMSVIHVDGKESSSKKKRNRPLPLPPHLQVAQNVQQQQQLPAMHHPPDHQQPPDGHVHPQQASQDPIQVIHQEDGTATVQYLQERPHETVITVTPLYQ